MKRLLLPLLTALALPIAVNAQQNYKILFSGNYDGYADIYVEKIYDEWTDTTSCNIKFQRWRATIDPSNYQITIKKNLDRFGSWSDGGYKFDNGWINKFNPKKIFRKGQLRQYEISIPYSKWSKHKILLVNNGTTLDKIDLKVINRARKHHQACLKGGPSWLY